MNISPENLLRISELVSKDNLCGLLLVIADIVAENVTPTVTPSNVTRNVTVTANALRQQRYRNAQRNVTRNAKGGGGDSCLGSVEDRDQGVESLDSPFIGKPSTRKPRAREPEGFAEFMDAYPKKVNRKAAATRYVTALRSGVTALQLRNGAERYARNVTNVEPQYIKAPDVWLNKGCWDDEDLPMPPKANQGNGIMAAISNFNGDDQSGENDGERRKNRNLENVLSLPLAGNE